MQLVSARHDISMPAPANRAEAAKALLAVPMGVLTVASMTAMTKSVSGQGASRADLVSPFLAKLDVRTSTAAILAAVDGALALAPELAGRANAMRQAAAGVGALLAEAARDTNTRVATESLERLTTPMQAAAMPLFEAAALLDPSIVQPPRRR
ncbi:MAG: hypothetical protein JWM86_2472 [Thermoleophilia bacterium]|nr:hypothetical protein [Thermoleophilia bacterium]